MGCFGETCLGVKQLAAGYYFACAVLTDTKLRCWGQNDDGQTSTTASDTSPEHRRPVEIEGLINVASVAATFSTACVLMEDKTVRCWGSNSGGDLGTGTTDGVPHRTPTAVAGLTDVSFLGGGSGRFCAIVAGGQIKCWGFNSTGAIGDGTIAAAARPPTTVCAPGSTTLPCPPATGATHVASGDDHTCAAFADGRVACWGGNGSGQLGRGNAGASDPFPKYVPGLTATALTGGNRITCAVSAGQAKCWGNNGFESLGIVAVATARLHDAELFFVPDGRDRHRDVRRSNVLDRERRRQMLGRQQRRPARRRQHHGQTELRRFDRDRIRSGAGVRRG
jgi:alpha-tubulin suppressor-like RCC1 family protein